MSKGKIWLLCDSFLGLWFGVSMYQVVDQSRPFRREALSSTSTLKVIGIGAASGLIFIVLGWLLGKLYEKARPTAGEFSALSTLVRVMVGEVIGGIIGATIFTPLMGVMGDLAVVFIDYHGVLL
ncbi:MAG: hypothetical protein HOC20_06355, partial [Chloroflexi bacterium]|nr:hypothetical protein [Chloroflexota bacterium]